jgi:outer membrane receptor protein involved in Fe transport
MSSPAASGDAVGLNLIHLYPPPNLPGIANNYLYQPSRTVTSDEGDFRLDRLTPNTVNIARFGWSRVPILGNDINQSQPYAQQLGIPNSNIPGDPNTYGLPLITVTGAAALGTQGGLPLTAITNNYQFEENLSLVRGRHTIQIDGDFTRLQYNVSQTSIRRGAMSFSTVYSQNPASSGGTGLGLADLLLGKPVSGGLQVIDGTRGLRRSDISAYFQDDYKINGRLTFNLGLRYENYIGYPWTEVHNRIYNFAPLSGVVEGGANGVTPSGVAGHNFNFMPRLGLAYRAGSKT